MLLFFCLIKKAGGGSVRLIRDVSSRLSIRTLLSTKIYIFRKPNENKERFSCAVSFFANFMNEGFHILISGLFLYKS